MRVPGWVGRSTPPPGRDSGPSNLGEFETCGGGIATSMRDPNGRVAASSKLHRPRLPRGLTLVEITIVIAIIAVLATIGVPIWASFVEDTREQAAAQELKSIQQEIQSFEARHGSLPASLEDAGLGDLRDPWGHPYQYIRIADTKGKEVKCRKDRSLHPINSDFDLYSMGPDGRTNLALTAKVSHDDIIRANDGAYFGVAADY